MAGRGRGRGRGGAIAFTAEVLGLGRGDSLPPPTSQPPPHFPVNKMRLYFFIYHYNDDVVFLINL